MVGHKLGEFSPTRTFKGHSAKVEKVAKVEGAAPAAPPKASGRHRAHARSESHDQVRAHLGAEGAAGRGPDPRQEGVARRSRSCASPRSAIARDIEKMLRSAIANAVNVADKNQKRRLDVDDLVVSAPATPTRARAEARPPGADGPRLPHHQAHGAPRQSPSAGEGRSRWVRKFIRTGSGWASTRPGAVALVRRRRTTPNLLHEDLEAEEGPQEALRARRRRRASRSSALANKLQDHASTPRAPASSSAARAQEIDKLKQEIQKTHRQREVFINIQEILKPELDAQLVAESIAHAAREAHRLPPRHAQGRRRGAALRRQGHQGARVAAA